MKNKLIVGTCLIILFVGILASGCTSSSNPLVNKDYYDKIKEAYQVIQLSDNVYFVECYNYNSCSKGLLEVSQNHTITTMTYAEGYTSVMNGLYIITDNATCKK